MIKGIEVFEIDVDVELLYENPPFSITAEKRNLVESIWQAEMARRGDHIYDAPLLFLIHKSKRSIHSRFIQYKDYIALRRRPDLFGGQEIFTLGVSGLLISDDCVFFARRAHHVTSYAGWHELIPSGGIDRTFILKDGRIDFIRQLALEMKEETGISEEYIDSKQPFALIYDEIDQTYDICVECILSIPVDKAIDVIKGARQNEYVEPIAIRIDDLDGFINDKKESVVPTSLAILEARKLLTSSKLTG